MNPEIFAEFLARQGHRIVKTETCHWYDARPGFYFYFPYHRLIAPSPEELRHILRDQRCIGVRFFTPMEDRGKPSYTLVCSDKGYDITSVDAHFARRQTRRGLETFKIEQLSFTDLAILGNMLNADTLLRQGRNPHTWGDRQWKVYCQATEGLAGFEAWGAFADGKLASFMMGFQMEDHWTILHQSSATEYLRSYPNNALVFAVTKLKLALPEVNTVSYGPQSLDAPESLDTFKFRMGYQQRPMKQKIVFNPLIEPFIGRAAHKCAQLAVRVRPQSDLLRKLEAIIRFYRERE
jgi:hypothetical protein